MDSARLIKPQEDTTNPSLIYLGNDLINFRNKSMRVGNNSFCFKKKKSGEYEPTFSVATSHTL
jgi:hypothetical protein